MGPNRLLCSFVFIFTVILHAAGHSDRALQEPLSHCRQALAVLTQKQQLGQGDLTASPPNQEMLPDTTENNDTPQEENRRK